MLTDTENLELTRLKSKFDYNLFYDERDRTKAQIRLNELLDKEKCHERDNKIRLQTTKTSG